MPGWSLEPVGGFVETGSPDFCLLNFDLVDLELGP